MAVAENFLSWSNLATFSGAVAAVVFLVQFLKIPLDKLKHVPTRLLVYAVSFVVLLLAHIFSGEAFGVETVALCLFNAVLVALTAMSVYEQTIAEPEAEKHDENILMQQDFAEQLADRLTDKIGVGTLIGAPDEVPNTGSKDEAAT